mmetsp:Transcript_49277/g.160190  ORF Transcript_49277/g.160190 Transcript_49277/m.160190 type:complete len:229 (+) Transcript_49277:174-860(+)
MAGRLGPWIGGRVGGALLLRRPFSRRPSLRPSWSRCRRRLRRHCLSRRRRLRRRHLWRLRSAGEPQRRSLCAARRGDEAAPLVEGSSVGLVGGVQPHVGHARGTRALRNVSEQHCLRRLSELEVLRVDNNRVDRDVVLPLRDEGDCGAAAGGDCGCAGGEGGRVRAHSPQHGAQCRRPGEGVREGSPTAARLGGMCARASQPATCAAPPESQTKASPSHTARGSSPST